MANSSHKTSRALRHILSFVICFFAVLLSVSVCAKSTFVNPVQLKSLFTENTYVSGLRENVSSFASDICIKNGISDKNINEIFDYSRVEETAVSYIDFYINPEKSHNQDAYIEKIDEMCADFRAYTTESLKRSDVSYSEKDMDNMVKLVADYFKAEVEITHIEYLQTAVNIGNVASNIMIAVCAFFTFSMSLIVFFIGKRRYRSARSISAAFLSAGFIDLFTSLIITIISNIKRVDIFPMYLRDAFMEYVHLCVGKIAVAGGYLIIVSVIILAIAWKLKRKDK